MSNLFRYLIAGTTAVLLILGPLAWAVQFGRNLQARIATEVKEQARAKGDLATANAPDAELLRDFGTELSAGDLNRLLIADLLFKFWWLWALVACAISYGLFVILGYFNAAAKAG